MATYRKLQVVKKSFNFQEATGVNTFPLVEPEPNLIRVKHIYAGVNATDINAVSGGPFSQDKLPFDLGFDV